MLFASSASGQDSTKPATPQASKAETLLERLPPKIHRIQKELPAWIEKSGNRERAAGLMQKLDGQLKAKNFEEVEKTADSILMMMGGKAEPPAVPAETMHKRISGKVERVKEGLNKWVASGHDPSAIVKTMQEKVGPLLDAGKPLEAEAELDRVLEQLGQPKAAAQDIPEEGLRRLRHELGGSFLVSRDKVQEELKLTRVQKEKLEQHLQKLWPDAAQFFQKIQGLKWAEQEKKLVPYRPKMREKLAALLKETLNEGQRTRLRQLELQKEGLRDGDIWNDLQVTDEQRRQFMALMQQALKEIYPLLEEAQKSGNPKKIQPKVIKIRDNLEATMEALLTDAQKTQWKEMLGKPMDHLDDLFDL